MNILKKIFKKKEDMFYDLLIKHAEKVYESYKLLEKYLTDDNEKTAEQIYMLERDADDLRRILINKLNKTLITPFDREDIFSLSRAVDDIIDDAKSTVEEIKLFNVKPNKELMLMVKVLTKGTLEILDSLKNLKNYPEVALEHAVKAKSTENQMNHIYLEALKDLFDNKKNSAGFMLKMRELYRHLNRSADRCDESANIISDIIVKIT